MSAIADVKHKIVAGSGCAEEAERALRSAVESIETAVSLFASAVDGSSQAQIAVILGAFTAARTSFEAGIELLADGRAQANSYRERLG